MVMRAMTGGDIQWGGSISHFIFVDLGLLTASVDVIRLTSYFVTHHNPNVVKSHSFSYGPNDGSYPRKRVMLANRIYNFKEKTTYII